METEHKLDETKMLKLVNIPSKHGMGKKALNTDKGPVPFSDNLCADATTTI